MTGSWAISLPIVTDKTLRESGQRKPYLLPCGATHHWPPYVAASWVPVLAYRSDGLCLGGEGAWQMKGHIPLPCTPSPALQGPSPFLPDTELPLLCVSGRTSRLLLRTLPQPLC